MGYDRCLFEVKEEPMLTDCLGALVPKGAIRLHRRRCHPAGWRFRSVRGSRGTGFFGRSDLLILVIGCKSVRLVSPRI